MVEIATFEDLLPRVRYDLSEVTAVTWSDDELYTYMNEGYKLIYNIISAEAPEWLLTQVSITAPSGSFLIDLPTDCMYVRSISRKDDGVFLSKVPVEDCWKMTTTSGNPSYWARYGQNQLLIAPKPQEDTDLYLFYIPYAQDLSSTDEIPLPAPFHQFIVEYAVIRAHNRNERPSLVEQNFLVLKLDMIRSILNAEGSLMTASPGNYLTVVESEYW